MTSRPHWPFGNSAEQRGRSRWSELPAADGFRAARIIHRTGHPSFTEDVATSLVAALSVSQLHEIWQLSSVWLSGSVERRTKTNLIVLRGAVLDALEAADPTFGSWLQDQALPLGPRPRS